MLRPRIIPCLLVSRKGLVKTVKFNDRKYVGDPLNTVKLFNEKEVDELAVFDIDASVNGAAPDYAMIRNLAAECRMPLCYGGGIKSVEQAVQIIKLGVEKVALSSGAVQDPQLVSAIAEFIGRQSVVVVLDVKRRLFGGSPEVWIGNGRISTGRGALDLAVELEHAGAGEIVVNSIDRDGTMKGYDLELARDLRRRVSVPLTILGGAGSLADLTALVQEFGTVGVGAGSLFVFKGSYRAVLISYPSREQKLALAAVAREHKR